MSSEKKRQRVNGVRIGHFTRRTKGPQPGQLVVAVAVQQVKTLRQGKAVTREEIHQARQLAPSPVREFLGLLWTTGARISEALAVRGIDLDTRHQEVMVQTLKRKLPTFRSCPVPGEYFAELLALVIQKQQRKGYDLEDRIFPWVRQHAYFRVRTALLMAGVDASRARPHAIRHGHAQHTIRNGVSLDVISGQLGHASIETTSKYLKATPDDVRRAYRKIDW